MADYQITCVTESKDAGHDRHIIIVGDGTRRWSVSEARRAIDQGDTFHTISPSTRKRAEVRKWICQCGYLTLKSVADAVTDNNLDNLQPCR